MYDASPRCCPRLGNRTNGCCYHLPEFKFDGDVYMALLQGIKAVKHQVCKLRKLLYRLKQAPHLWYEHIDHFLRSLGLQ